MSNGYLNGADKIWVGTYESGVADEIGVDYSLTHSCYFPRDNGSPCAECDSCRIRKQGFNEANVYDPASEK